AEEAIGRSIRLIVPEDRLGELEELLDSVRAGQTARSVETVRIDSEGREVEVSLTVSPLRGADGAPIGKSVIARNVTGHRQAERQFRLAVESSPSAMVMVDERGSIVMVNAETERLFGYDREELIGTSIEVLVPRRSRDAHPGLRAGFLRAPETRAMGAGRELYGLRKDGREIPVEIGLNPIRTEDGLFVLSSIVDITERKEAEQKFRLAVEASPSGIVMVDGGGTIVLVNRETERMFGYDREELVGESVDVLVPRRARSQHAHDRDHFLRAPEARAMGSGRDLHGLRKDGTEFPVEIGLNPIRTPDGPLVLSTIVDITGRKHAEDALAERTAELARSNAELEQFAYVASHDLQEPLRMIASYTELLAKRYADQLDERAAKYIGYAQDGAARMRRLIEDLLAYSRVRTRGRAPQRVAASRCLTQALENLRLQIRETGASVEQGELPSVLADETQLTEVFQNLLSNALKFRGEDPPRIRVWAERQDGHACFYVEDNGIGVSAEHAERIFQVFERLHTRDEYPGTGIGLALCKRVIERHGGHIGVRSEPGGGATFWFTLPVAGRGQSSDEPSRD
ncbi:MAG: PAS domain S-box protein, partial [Polyangiales bacterium]